MENGFDINDLLSILQCSGFDKAVNLRENTGDGLQKIDLFTATNHYIIIVRDDDGTTGYLGCVVFSRPSIAVEDWTHSDDLPEGPFCIKTFDKILLGIVKHELIKPVKKFMADDE